ncbi:YqeG family HAD IIIA-type phosphatase [Caldanaerobacter sp.]|uniref:YqeG family HAD IIIA-type phosphatase n=1 Tax=Caldanaerobacter sp. TaxID=2930036 RepID=UPI003C7881CB
MYKKLIPDMIVESVHKIDLNFLKNKGITSLILDIDNTLLPKKEKFLDKYTVEWLEIAKKEGFKICLVSNNTRKRVNQLKEKTGIPGIAWAIKPRKGAFKKALKLLDAKPHETAIIGDQIFTDILGGKRVGLFTILVKPLSDDELAWTKIVRRAERIILKRIEEYEN